MVKLKTMLREVSYLVREHRFYFLAPILICLVVFAIMIFKVGPGIVMTFIYAGI